MHVSAVGRQLRLFSDCIVWFSFCRSFRVLEIYMFYAPEQGTQAEQQPLTDPNADDRHGDGD